MEAFITNFQSPVELEDLIDRYETDRMTNIDHFFSEATTLDWTVKKDAQINDIVVFMCAKTSKDHMGHVCAQCKEIGNQKLLIYAEQERQLYKKYAGMIVGLGIIQELPYQTFDSGYQYSYWKSPWYAKISNITRLKNPLPIDEFRDFIYISRTGAITNLTRDQYRQLFKLIKDYNFEINDKYQMF